MVNKKKSFENKIFKKKNWPQKTGKFVGQLVENVQNKKIQTKLTRSIFKVEKIFFQSEKKTEQMDNVFLVVETVFDHRSQWTIALNTQKNPGQIMLEQL